MSLYGTRDAGHDFELAVTKVVTEAGCLQEVCKVHDIFFFSNPSDDFVIGGAREGSAWPVAVLEKVFIVRDRGRARAGQW